MPLPFAGVLSTAANEATAEKASDRTPRDRPRGDPSRTPRDRPRGDPSDAIATAGAAELARDFRERYAAAPRILREADGLPAALSAIRGSLTAAPVPRVLEEALAANALNALADEPPTELATLSPDSAKWKKRGKTTPKSNSGSFAPEDGDTQVRRLGYRDRADLLAQADTVPEERVVQLLEGGKSRCKAHEAVAVLKRNPVVRDASGRAIRFPDELIGHYVHGQRRQNNVPRVKALNDLPLAIHAVRNDQDPKLKFKFGAVRDVLSPPRGTQRVYRTPTGEGPLHVFAYVDSGKVQGWFPAK